MVKEFEYVEVELMFKGKDWYCYIFNCLVEWFVVNDYVVVIYFCMIDVVCIV